MRAESTGVPLHARRENNAAVCLCADISILCSLLDFKGLINITAPESSSSNTYPASSLEFWLYLPIQVFGFPFFLYI
jgi:hypothetical protein